MIQNEIILSLLPLIIINGIILISFIIFAFIYPKRPNDPEILKRMHRSFVGVFLREYWYWLTTPLTNIFRAVGLTPNYLTGISLIMAILSGYFFYKGNFALAGWILIICGTMDLLDGRLARLTNMETTEGAFFDSCADRYSDGIVILGIALHFKDNLFMLFVSIMTLIGSELISYAKARGEAIGITTNSGIMQRPERVVLISIVSVLHPFLMLILLGYNITTEYPMIVVMVLMSIMTNFTAISRIVIIFNKIRKTNQIPS